MNQASDPFKRPGTPVKLSAAREEAAMPYDPDAASSPGAPGVEQVRQRHERSLMATEGVTGVGIGRTPTGDDAILVYLRHAATRKALPSTLEGYPVIVEVTGDIDAYGGKRAP
jgi:hypothetical protein